MSYRLVNMSHPWDEKMRKDGVKAWCLCEEVRPELGLSTIFTPIALFNLDSACERFAAHCYLGQTVEVGDDLGALFANLQRVKR